MINTSVRYQCQSCKEFIGMHHSHTQMSDSKDAYRDDENKTPDDEVDHELEKLRLKRMQSLIQQKQRQTQQSQGNYLTLEDKIRMVVQIIMTPEAFHYFLEIKERDVAVYQRIQEIILPPEIMSQLDLLVQYAGRGMLRPNIIDKIQIQQLERKLLGIGPKITVKKRDGESTDLNSFLKNNHK
jgi:DNA-binding TFAR19-related protein (PDSD5 family)